MKGTFLTDVQEIRKRARQHVEKGAVTEGYRADRETVVKLLNEALATEIVCVLRYKRHYFMATGIQSPKSFTSTRRKNKNMPMKLPSALRNWVANRTSIRMAC
jgi:hypothetical protein